MGGFASIVRGALAGLNQAAGNPHVAQNLEAQNEAARQAKQSELRAKMFPHAVAIRGLQQKLAATTDPHEQAAITHDIARNLAEVRQMIHPDENPNGNFFERGITDKLHLTTLKNRQDKLKAQQASGAAQDQSQAQSLAQGTVPYDQTPTAMMGKQKDLEALRFQQQQTQQKQQEAFALIDTYIKDPEQNKTAKEDYVRKQAGIQAKLKNIPGAGGQPYEKSPGLWVRPVDNGDGTVGEEAMPAGWKPPAAKQGQPKAGISHGKNVFATLTPNGWVDAGNGEPLNDFRPLPNYAQVAPTLRATQVVDPNDPNSTVYVSTPEAIKGRMQGTQSTGYRTRAALQKAFTTGTAAQNITSINTLRGHLSLLRKAAEALQNNDVRLFNSLTQRFSQETGQAAPTNFQSMKTAVASELARTLTGKGATVQEIAQIEGPLNVADSPEQLSGALDTFDSQMQSRLEALHEQYNSGMQGKPAFGETPNSSQHKVGEKKKFPNGRTGVWDGHGWVAQ